MIEKTKKLNVTAQEELVQVKIGLVGDQGTGKSTFVERVTNQTFKSYHEPTLGVDTAHSYLPAKINTINHLTYWDFSGKLEFVDIRNEFYRQANVILVFVDLSVKKTVESLDYWVSQIKDNGANTILVVGNKKDIKKINDVEMKSKDKGCSYCEVSCKTEQGMQELVAKIIALSK